MVTHMATEHESWHSPFFDNNQSAMPGPCVVVIFGATGDLTARRLVPALYNLAKEGLLPAHFACVGFARRDKTDELFRAEMLAAIQRFSRSQPIDPEVWQFFSERLFYHRSEFDNTEGYRSLSDTLKKLDLNFGTKGNRIYYLSTPPSHFPTIVHNLQTQGLLYNETSTKFSRVVMEKPFGHDYPSAIELQKNLMGALREDQLYRIDHWLGKETVQNLLVMRFANAIFEPLWNHQFIDHVQITVGEEEGVGTRGRFYEEAGALRDLVQNHILQLVCLMAVEPPSSLTSEAIRSEKVRVLSSIRPITAEDVDRYAVRGQYGPGFIQGKPVIGYRQEENVSTTSNIETYAALQLWIDNPRWTGVPFFLRAGKRLPKRVTEIAVFFKKSSSQVFSMTNSQEPNVLAIRIQPNESISVRINSKVPGSGYLVQPVTMDFRYRSYFGTTPPEAYERLLCDCMLGDPTLFARQDEVLASWKLIQPVVERWAEQGDRGLSMYPAGTWGPETANQLIGQEHHQWRLS